MPRPSIQVRDEAMASQETAMTYPSHDVSLSKPAHAWLRTIRAAFVPGESNPLAEETMRGMSQRFRQLGHHVQESPDGGTDVLVTTAPYQVPLGWRQAMLFTGRRRFQLRHLPTLYTIVTISPERFAEALDRFRGALAKEPPDPKDFAFAGLAPRAWRVLVEQGLRGGPILSFERLVQAQSKCLRIILVVGREKPLEAYHFDLVGAYPRSDAGDPEAFYDDIVMRMVTSVSTSEVTNHEVVGDPMPLATWKHLSTPAAMRKAGKQLAQRRFFTDMVRIADLVHVPSVAESVASQYSEGCFATWEPDAQALVATVTGSARPVDKGSISDEELALIMGVRPDATGALVRHVSGKGNLPPSSEAVELMEMDAALPRVSLGAGWPWQADMPVVRSKLHGHRGVAAYDPSKVEYVELDPPYYNYIVSCATRAQAEGITRAFSRSVSLTQPGDPRQVVFAVLPGHGVVIAEQWVRGKAPFETIWEYIDLGYIEIDTRIPQGPMRYLPDGAGKLRLDPQAVPDVQPAGLARD